MLSPSLFVCFEKGSHVPKLSSNSLDKEMILSLHRVSAGSTGMCHEARLLPLPCAFNVLIQVFYIEVTILVSCFKP